VMMGAERRSLMITDEEKETTAYHEVGHALVAASIEEVDPVHKVSIIPRGRALGVTMLLPEEDRHSHNKRALLGQIAMMMGGRAAEQLVFKRFTTGASDDLKRATELARKMVCQWGMSEKLGPLTYAEDAGHVFLGRDLQQHKEFSNESMKMIDEEVLEILNSSYDRAKKVLKTYRKALESLAETLLEKETIDGDHVLQAMQQFAPKTKKRLRRKKAQRLKIDEHVKSRKNVSLLTKREIFIDGFANSCHSRESGNPGTCKYLK